MPGLTYAVVHSSPEGVQLLLDHGAKVDIAKSTSSSMDNPYTALEMAKQLGKTEMVSMLEKAMQKQQQADSTREMEKYKLNLPIL